MLFGEIGFPDTVEKIRSAAAVRLARAFHVANKSSAFFGKGIVRTPANVLGSSNTPSYTATRMRRLRVSSSTSSHRNANNSPRRRPVGLEFLALRRRLGAGRGYGSRRPTAPGLDPHARSGDYRRMSA